MATVYSLICWGGRTGKSVTASNSSGLIFTTSAAHGLRDATALQFTATTLPGNVAANTTYYAKVLSSTTFSIYTESVLTNRVAWSSAGTGVYAKSKKMLDYFASNSGRWGASGSERCYDGIESFESVRSAVASSLDEEVCELGEAFTETANYDGNHGGFVTTINVPSAKLLITSTVNGNRSSAFHFGIVGNGYSILLGYKGFSLKNNGTVLDGFSITTAYINGIDELQPRTVISNMIIVGKNTSAHGVYVGLSSITVVNNLIYGCNEGISIYAFCKDLNISGNTSVKNVYGIKVTSGYEYSASGYFYNNVMLGNTTQNWGTAPSLLGATGNAGGSGEAWKDTSGTRIEITEASPFSATFVDFTNNNFKPKNISSPLVDSGVEYYGIPSTDIAGAEHPNYNNGGSEAFDVGCYEYDHGYGNHPASTTVMFLGVVAGSEIHVYDSEDNELVGTESCTANQSLTWGIPTNPNVKITIIKRGLRWQKFNYASKLGAQSIPIFQSPDLGYSNPA